MVDKTLFPFTRALQIRPGVDPVGPAVYLDVVKPPPVQAVVQTVTSTPGMPGWALAIALGAIGDLVVVRQLLARILGWNLHSPSSLAEDLFHQLRSRHAEGRQELSLDPAALQRATPAKAQTVAVAAVSRAVRVVAGASRRAQAGGAAVAGVSVLLGLRCVVRARRGRASRSMRAPAAAVVECEPEIEEELVSEMNIERLVSDGLDLQCDFYRIGTEMPSYLDQGVYQEATNPELGCVYFPIDEHPTRERPSTSDNIKVAVDPDRVPHGRQGRPQMFRQQDLQEGRLTDETMLLENIPGSLATFKAPDEQGA